MNIRETMAARRSVRQYSPQIIRLLNISDLQMSYISPTWTRAAD
jgi:hypothetical protein